MEIQSPTAYVKPEPTRQFKGIFIPSEIILDTRVSLEALGVYARIEAGSIKIDDVPSHLIHELLEVGYLKEVK